jgi:hypothetical protein
MRLTLFILLLFVLVLHGIPSLYAQGHGADRRPDYKRIRQLTSDPASPMFYSRLFMRYINDDTTLTQQEFHLLYYGYFFRDEYDSYGSVGYKDSIKSLGRKEGMTMAEGKRMISFAKRDLKFTPFDLNDLNWLGNLYYAMGDIENNAVYKYKAKMVAATILSSGDGRTDSTGYHVLSVGDEYNIVSHLGLIYKAYRTNTEKKYDYITVSGNSRGISGVYFDVSQLLEGDAKRPK